MTYTPRPEDTKSVPPAYDEVIRKKLSTLSLDELIKLSELSGTTMNSGYLMSNDVNDREIFIDEISDISEKAQWQLDKIRQELGIEL